MSPTGTAARFGFKPGERLLIPASMASEFLAGVRVFPVPRAPRRLAGLVHLRGNALMVIDLADKPSDDLPVIRPANVLVLGEADEAFAVLCEHPPVPLTVKPPEANDDGAPQCNAWCASALTHAGTAGGQDWWEPDLAALVELGLHRTQAEPV